MIADTIKRLMEHVREGEYSSCPFIVNADDKIIVAMFTYYASDEVPIIVYGYGQFLSYDGNKVVAEEKNLFENECDLITINDVRMVSGEQHRALYNAYYSALQDLVEHYSSVDRQLYIDAVAGLFKKLIPDDALELYRRMCPDYLTLLNI